MRGAANMTSQEGVTLVKMMKNIREMGCEPYLGE
jgi:hypothetical protein